MADSASESYVQSHTVYLRHISSSFFNIPGFFVGFSSRVSSDSDSLKSPTSPLDFSFLSNISNPFSQRSPTSPPQSCHQKKWDCCKVGLGIVKLLADESELSSETLDSPNRKSIIFGPQVKVDSTLGSNSFPSNYIIDLLSQSKNTCPAFKRSDAILGNEQVVPHEHALTPMPGLNSKGTFSENIGNSVASLPLAIGGGSQIDKPLDVKLSSQPMPIGSGHGYVGSLSAREIELSEDYTCIISHGPNPKTTHIFGDYILECHTNELPNFDKADNLGIELPLEAKCPERSSPTLHLPDNLLSFCCSCKKKLEKGDDIYMCRGEKAFCSFDCRSEEIFAQEETAKTCDDSSKSSPGSSYHEDLFLIGMPITM